MMGETTIVVVDVSRQMMGTLVGFFAMTFVATWTCFGVAVMLSRSAYSNTGLIGVLVFAGTMMPAVVALAMTARRSGETAAILNRLGRWGVSGWWYLFAFGYMAVVRFATAAVFRAATGVWPVVETWTPVVMIFSILVSTPIQAGEEIGWRGFALPRLSERMGVAGGSLVLGVLWACWHLPLFLLQVPGNNEYGQSFFVWALGVVALSVAMAWLYFRTNESLPAVMLMHAAVNNLPHFAPASVTNARDVFSWNAPLTAWLTTGFLWIGAAWFLWQMRGQKMFRRAVSSS